MSGRAVAPVLGLVTVAAIAGIVTLAAGLFRGSFTDSVPVTVLSPRAGLVMNPDARVKLRDVQVGKVSSIEEWPNGQAALHLAIEPSKLHLIPANVLVDIASTTVFGAKLVQLVPPAHPSPQTMHAGQVLDAKSVTVEINTVFEQLTSVLSKIEPAKLNETLGALASALNGRGHKVGQMLANLDSALAQLDPSLRNLGHDIVASRTAFGAYADAAPDLIKTADNATRISQTMVDEQTNLDALLISAIGLADIGNDVLGGNRRALTSALHLLVPTTDLASKYDEALTCTLGCLVPMAKNPPQPEPGAVVSVSFTLGIERYRYPGHLPKVAATGGPHCKDQHMPAVPFDTAPPFAVADIGANPWHYGNQGILLNFDGLKQLLYGPIDGPPRNSAHLYLSARIDDAHDYRVYGTLGSVAQTTFGVYAGKDDQAQAVKTQSEDLNIADDGSFEIFFSRQKTGDTNWFELPPGAESFCCYQTYGDWQRQSKGNIRIECLNPQAPAQPPSSARALAAFDEHLAASRDLFTMWVNDIPARVFGDLPKNFAIPPITKSLLAAPMSVSA